MSARRRRPIGCRKCGSLQHRTKTHAGRLARHAIDEVSARRDPLGIARSSWLVNNREPRTEADA
jgi:hypothetical protein